MYPGPCAGNHAPGPSHRPAGVRRHRSPAPAPAVPRPSAPGVIEDLASSPSNRPRAARGPDAGPAPACRARICPRRRAKLSSAGSARASTASSIAASAGAAASFRARARGAADGAAHAAARGAARQADGRHGGFGA
ncbi:hypothetical protein G6F40_015441 [Rhizopus arrhizus]|nr:hypothetical protein G6F40_015441 [Rhizopus arrhizus]